MVSKDAFHVRLIFPATGLDSETLKGLGIVASPAAVGRAHIGDMFHGVQAGHFPYFDQGRRFYAKVIFSSIDAYIVYCPLPAFLSGRR